MELVSGGGATVEFWEDACDESNDTFGLVASCMQNSAGEPGSESVSLIVRRVDVAEAFLQLPAMRRTPTFDLTSWSHPI